MKKITSTLLISIFITGLGRSQTTPLGNPMGWNGKLDQKSIPQEIMPGYDQDAIDAEDAINDANKASVWRFGYKYQTSFDLNNSGVWNTLPNGDRIWQLGIQAPGALTMNLLLENVNLPEGASLYLYDQDMTNYVGAYTSRNNRDDQLLGTELVHGEKIIVEYYEPKEVKNQGSLTITDVVHGYRSLNIIQNKLLKALNSSGDCNIDVNCPLGNGWEDQIRSVAMIVVGGNGSCTGALINNTCDDGTPYFLTADHCLGAGGGPGNWAFRFNWDSPPGTESCATTAGSTNPGPPYDQTANGATILANSGNSDFALLQIDNMTVTDAQNWNAFYAGWDNTDDPVSQSTGIHHPSGDVKKICREDDALVPEPWNGAQCWRVSNWDQGVTEPGSSGSPLFDQDGRIVGQLYGGGAACSGTNDNGQPDWYGRFAVSWNLGVSTYLANSCGSASTNDGWDPNQPSVADDAGINAINNPTSELCTDTFDPEVVLNNFGSTTLTSVTINYDIDGGTNNTFSWTGSLAPGGSTNVTLPTVTTTGGNHVFNASTSNPNGNPDQNTNNDGATTNFFVGTTPVTLVIETDCWGSEVTWDITDAGGNTVQSGGPYNDVAGGTTETYNFCLAEECYDFTIYDDFGDGMYGSQYPSCSVDGNYTITEDASGDVLASMIAANAAYDDDETNNFCVASNCGMTFTTSTTEEQCFGDNDGSITVNVTGGSAPYSYDIGTGSQSNNQFNNQPQGSYNIDVEDNTGCIQTVNVTLGGPTALTTSANVTNETCIGSGDGSILATANGGISPYSFNIGTGTQATGNFENLSPNTYTVTITDANGCSSQVTNLQVTSGTGISGNTSVINVSCIGDSDGTITVNTTNGVAPFNFDIGNGNQTSNQFNGLAPGMYTIDITDDNGCTGQVTGNVSEPSPINASATSNSDDGTGSGSINLSVSGGTPGYTYSWIGPNGFTSSAQNPNGLDAGGYSVTITDSNGCTETLTDIEVTSTASIFENEINVSIYPNPTTGKVVISTKGMSQKFDIKVTDVTGRVIISDIMSGDENEVSLLNNASGTYFISVKSDDFHTIQRIVKK